MYKYNYSCSSSECSSSSEYMQSLIIIGKVQIITCSMIARTRYHRIAVLKIAVLVEKM